MAATGASTAELMRRAGHKSAAVALHNQHATEDRDRVLAGALGPLASADVVPTSSRSDGRRTDDVRSSWLMLPQRWHLTRRNRSGVLAQKSFPW